LLHFCNYCSSRSENPGSLGQPSLLAPQAISHPRLKTHDCTCAYVQIRDHGMSPAEIGVWEERFLAGCTVIS
jgi:hypothetical protein